MEFLFLSFNTSSDLYKYDTATPQTSTNSLSHPLPKTHTYPPLNLNSSDDLNQNYISTPLPTAKISTQFLDLVKIYNHTHIHTPPKIMSNPPPDPENSTHPTFWTCTNNSHHSPIPTSQQFSPKFFGLGQYNCTPNF
jgi:hypothetical protein